MMFVAMAAFMAQAVASAPPANIVAVPRSADESFQQGRHSEAFVEVQTLLEQCLRERAGSPRDCIELQLALAEFAPAAKELSKGEAAARDAVAAWSDGGPPSMRLGKAYNNLGFVLAAQGKLDEAEAAYRRALSIFGETLPAGDGFKVIVAENLLSVLERANRLEESGSPTGMLTAMARVTDGQLQERIRKLLDRTADKLNGRGLFLLSEPIERTLLDLAERNPAATVERALALENLGTNLGFQERTREALDLFRQSASLLQEKMRADGPEGVDRLLARVLRQQAVTFSDLGRFAEAESNYRRAVAIYEALRSRQPGSETDNYLTAVDGLAGALQSQFRYDESERYYRVSLTLRRQAFGDDSLDVARTANNLATLLNRTNREEDAIGMYRLALEIFVNKLGPDHPDTATLQQNLGVSLQKAGVLDEAEQLLWAALKTRRVRLGERPATALSEVGLADLLRTRGRAPEAAMHFDKAIAILMKELPIEHPARIRGQSMAGVFYTGAGRADRGLRLFRESAAGALRRMFDSSEFTPEVLLELRNASAAFHGQVQSAWALAEQSREGVR